MGIEGDGMTDAEKTHFNAIAVIEQARDLCRDRQIACVALARSNIDHNTEYARNAFAVYRDAADALTKVLEII